MKKLLTAIALAACFTAPAQTLFSYGKHTVSAEDFMRAFKKNNQGKASEKAIREYLDLYIASRLKIQEAKEKGYDTLPQLVADLANLRQQILPAYINDKETMDRLVNEAFARSQKDIHLAHIFLKNEATEEATVAKKAKLLAALNSNKSFASIAAEFSADPAAATNGGDLGWITVFSLPYELENLAYSTEIGKTSAIFRSKVGHHIFKNLGERKAVGQIKTAQILLALPPNSNEATKAKLKKTADSIYARIKAGDDFGKLALAFSNDVVSAASNGQMAEFGVGEFEPAFEDVAFALPADGAVSKPFFTAHGYHIVKRLGAQPVATKLDAVVKEILQKKVEQSDRILSAKELLAQKVLKLAGFQKTAFSDVALMAYSDSVLDGRRGEARINLEPSSALFSIGNHKATVADWITYSGANRYKQDGSGVKPHQQLWNEFVNATALNYYGEHLEDFNPEFKQQVTEFAEGNLFFEIMQRQVWSPAQTDSAALLAFYERNRTNYKWAESADAVVFYTADEKLAKDLYNELRKKPAAWKTVVAAYAEQVTADSSRFELSQLPKTTKPFAAGMLTPPVLNKADDMLSFAYIIRLHAKEEPRSFADAKGLLVNDYQAVLEKAWLEELRKKYPVTISEQVLRDLVKTAN